jgi:hypothetical protein
MARRPRIKYTEELKAEIWGKYKKGESLWSISRLLFRGYWSKFLIRMEN